MKKQFLMLLTAGALVFSGCNEDRGTSTETNENDSSTPDSASGTDSSATSYNSDAHYHDRASRLSQQVSADLKLDSATQARIQTVYFNRARQMDELEFRFTSTNRSGGLAADSASPTNEKIMNGNMDVSGTVAMYPAAYMAELGEINNSTDAELQGFLSSEQFKLYNANRQKYYEMDMEYRMQTNSNQNAEEEEAKYKTDDIKIKKDGDEMKVKTDDLKIKKDGDESKLKTDDAKLKREPDEVKYKTDNTKIKVEN